jgi:hypothetical protein
MKKEKFFRIWDKEKEKYYSTGKKSIWKSFAWASANLTNCPGSYSRYEVHELETIVVNKTCGLDVAIDLDYKQKMKEETQRRLVSIKNEILDLTSHSGDLYDIKEQWKKGNYNDFIQSKLTSLFEEYETLNKLV